MQRFVQLGTLIPKDLPGVLDNADTRAEVKLVLDEMAKVRGEIDAYLDRARALREGTGHAARQLSATRED
jgi:hypothetical protein